MEQTKKAAPIGRRRGILAIGAAVAAGIAVKGAAQPVAAATSGNGFIATGAADVGFLTQGTFRVGANALGDDTGVFGGGKTGVSGNSGSGNGVVGSTFGGVFLTPVSGKTGVMGTANGDGNFGVLGIGSANNGNNTIGVWGDNPSGGAGPVGVFGSATNGVGVFGKTGASGSFGVLGTTTATNSIGLGGIANTNGSAAVAGGTANPNAFAGSFQGHVQVFDGAFDVFPMGNKHGLAQHPDGSVRTFYSVESPECWVEDFGEGTLANGVAEVSLEKDFAALIHTDRYHVFLTPHGDHHLHVAQRHDGGFSVAADTALATLKGKKASELTGTFSWRVVAKPKTTANVERLARGQLAPKIDTAKLPKQPDAPQTITPNAIAPPSTPNTDGAPNPSPTPRTQ